MQVHFAMKGRSKRSEFPLAIALCLLLAVCPAILLYSDLVEIDFLSPDLSFENLDQENSLVDGQSKSRIFAFNPSPEFFLPGIFFSVVLFCLSGLVFSAEQPVPVLRC
jgi:hypothetical protein